MRNILIIGLVVIVGLVIFMLMSGSNSSEKVHIRIQNNSDQDIKNFWLGAGGLKGPSPESYGSIKKGETTSYKSLDAVLARYRKTDFITQDDKRYGDVVYPEQFFDKAELEAGHYYTIVYDIQNGKAVLTLTEEEPQD